MGQQQGSQKSQQMDWGVCIGAEVGSVGTGRDLLGPKWAGGCSLGARCVGALGAKVDWGGST